MSESTIFIIGVIIFAITIYGVVMVGGSFLTRIQIEQNPHLREAGEEGEGKGGFPRDEY